MANRVITAAVSGEYIRLSNKIAGASGSYNAVSLSLTFDSTWDSTTKTVYFYDIYGASATPIELTALLYDSETGAYTVPIPAEPLAYPGEMTLTIRGVELDGETTERIMMSASTTMKVLDSTEPTSTSAPVAPTPTETEQLWAAINALNADRPYGEIYISNNTTAQAIPTGDTYTKATGFTADGQGNLCTNDYANSKITINDTGIYVITGTFSTLLGTNNVTLDTKIFIDDVAQDNLHITREFVGAGAYLLGGVSGLVDITSVPVDVDVRVKHDYGSSVNITVHNANLNVVRIDT